MESEDPKGAASSHALIRSSGSPDVTAIVPRSFPELQQMAVALAAARVVASFKQNPADVLAVIMSGSEMGLPPMASLRAFYVFDGNASLKADGMAAVAIAHPECEYLRKTEESAEAATWTTKRRGEPAATYRFTIEDAARAGLVKEGSNWKKWPGRMCSARSKAFLLRDVYPDVFAGIASTEEMEDGGVTTVGVSFVAPPPSGTAPAAESPKLTKKAQAALDAQAAAAKTASTPVVAEVVKEAPAEAKQANPTAAATSAPVTESKPVATVEPPVATVSTPSTTSTATADDAPAPFSDDGDDFGGEDGEPAMMVSFRADLAAATKLEQLDEVRKKYSPWSREAANAEHVQPMKEAFAARKAALR